MPFNPCLTTQETTAVHNVKKEALLPVTLAIKQPFLNFNIFFYFLIVVHKEDLVI
jgi:hypothetical protein